jgi:hypothetical protein
MVKRGKGKKMARGGRRGRPRMRGRAKPIKPKARKKPARKMGKPAIEAGIQAKPRRVKILIQELDASGQRSLRGRCFRIIGGFDDVVQRIENMLLEGFAAYVNPRGYLLFVPYSGSGEVRCPFCNALIGFDPHDNKCPLHKVTVAKWLNQDIRDLD